MTHNDYKHLALAFLRNHHMGVLSTVSNEGLPWGAAIYFVVDDDFKIYFVTRAGTAKYQNIEKNPQVALTVADEPSQRTVQIAGTIAAVPVQDYMDIVFKKLASIRPKDDLSWTPPVSKVHEGYFMPLCITPTKLQYANYKEHKHDLKDRDFIRDVI